MNDTLNRNALTRSLENARARLLDARDSEGAWTGELSSSALSTATALCALTVAQRCGMDQIGSAQTSLLAQNGLDWLIQHQNPDGGWGDTPESPANISTTTLCWAALGMHQTAEAKKASMRAEEHLKKLVGLLNPSAISKAICARYGIDRTFSVPILTMCAVSGRFGQGSSAWSEIPPFPFELGTLPRRWFGKLGLSVVSYALPALIAIGQAQHSQCPTTNPLARCWRNLSRRKTMRILSEIQPESGGFLEAAPLTSFVAMSLLSAGLKEHPATRKCLAFLANTVREDGSWAIDTNLRIWVSTLSVKALESEGNLTEALSAAERRHLLDWLLSQQQGSTHPYTLAAPGGWAWTNLSGGVPDGDDTPGALLALRHLADKGADGKIVDSRLLAQAREGIEWLLALQNRDGGIPTFCRGWGKLPFDQSSPDLTAHALRAWFAWRDDMPQDLCRRMDQAALRGLKFLLATQQSGGWIPLWFGNQLEPDQRNPVYGTSMVLKIPDLPLTPAFNALANDWSSCQARAMECLFNAQHGDGGWGGGAEAEPSVEETALAVEALACFNKASRASGKELRRRIRMGCDWLIQATQEGTHFPAAPIGLYFAKLWYHEKLYPLIFTVAALNRAIRCLGEEEGLR